MKYCNRCIIPDTRPGIVLNDDGLCNACISYDTRSVIDWNKRKEIFCDIVKKAKNKRADYDCIVPVSGGKDSTWQIVTCLEYGLRPLAVTLKPPARTNIGQENLDNLISLGVDHIDYQINPVVEKKILYRALVDYGSTAIPMHMAMYNIPMKVAVRFGIPLIVWGENSVFEYGGDEEESKNFRLNLKWIRICDITHGTTAKDWVSEDLSEKELTPYYGPTEEQMEKAEVMGIFLGYFFPWDPKTSLDVAVAHGFKVRAEGAKTGYYNYADIDDDFISIHHYIKWHKFGINRLFDNLSLEIRNGRMTRTEAINIIRDSGEQTPHKDIEKFCRFIGITTDHFFEIIETYRNPKIWKKRGDRWIIVGFLIDDWKWV